MRRTARIGSTLALAAVAAVLPSCGLGRGDTYEVVASFPRAVSLYESGSVQVLGLPAGEVTDVTVEPDRVRVTMAIDSDVPLPADVKAAIVPQSLIGERRVQLFPPYQTGDPIAGEGHEIAMEDTIVPVEPDEALDALQEFLDSLDPEGVGRLIDNGADALEGRGTALGAAVDELSGLVGTVEDNDDAIIDIAERFDALTGTLLSREDELAEILDDFAVATDILATERDDIERLIRGLASASGTGLDLVSEHALRLRTDVQILERLTSAIDANLGSVDDVLQGAADTVAGLGGVLNEDLDALNLRTNLSPLLGEALGPVFDAVGLPFPCVPVDVECPSGSARELAGSGTAQAFDPAPQTTPISAVLAFLGSPTVDPPADDREPAVAADTDPGLAPRFLRTLLGVTS